MSPPNPPKVQGLWRPSWIFPEVGARKDQKALDEPREGLSTSSSMLPMTIRDTQRHQSCVSAALPLPRCASRVSGVPVARAKHRP